MITYDIDIMSVILLRHISPLGVACDLSGLDSNSPLQQSLRGELWPLAEYHTCISGLIIDDITQPTAPSQAKREIESKDAVAAPKGDMRLIRTNQICVCDT